MNKLNKLLSAAMVILLAGCVSILPEAAPPKPRTSSPLSMEKPGSWRTMSWADVGLYWAK